jgi:DNA-binding Lrp family transcriptional regulator
MNKKKDPSFIDEKDVQIMAEVEKNPSILGRELNEITGLKTTANIFRRGSMIRRGIITEHIRVNYDKLGWPHHIKCICNTRNSQTDKVSIEEVTNILSRFGKVSEYVELLGPFNVMYDIHIRNGSDLSSLISALKNRINDFYVVELVKTTRIYIKEKDLITKVVPVSSATEKTFSSAFASWSEKSKNDVN